MTKNRETAGSFADLMGRPDLTDGFAALKGTALDGRPFGLILPVHSCGAKLGASIHPSGGRCQRMSVREQPDRVSSHRRPNVLASTRKVYASQCAGPTTHPSWRNDPQRPPLIAHGYFLKAMTSRLASSLGYKA
jgi:hypothetical protein